MRGRVRRGPRSHARNGRALLSPRRLLRRHRAQALEKLRFVDGLLENGIGFTGSECGVTGDHDDPNTLIGQLHDRGVRVIVITGYAALAPGKADAILQKPIDEAQLLECLRSVTAQESTR